MRDLLTVAGVTLGAVFTGAALWMAVMVARELYVYHVTDGDMRRDPTVNPTDQYSQDQAHAFHDAQVAYRERTRNERKEQP